MSLSQILKVSLIIFTLELWGGTIREEACEEQELVVIEGDGINGGEGLSKASLVIS